MAELSATENDQILDGTPEADVLDATGFSGNTLNGLGGDDELFAGSDGELLGGAGRDLLDATAGGGGNLLLGGRDGDTLVAGGDDSLFGESGNDTLIAGPGGSTLTGGVGGDIFSIAQADVPDPIVTIEDFTRGSDRLAIAGADIAAGLDDLTLTETEEGTVVSAGGEDLALLRGFFGELTENDANFDDFAGGNTAPEVAPANFEIAETSEVGTVVGTVSASDGDGDEVSFAIASGNPDLDEDGTPAFAIAPDSGELTVADSDDLDAESQPSVVLDVTASDSSLLGNALVEIEVLGVNEAPEFAEDPFEFAPVVVLASAEGDAVGFAGATDPENDPLTFAITGGNDPDGNGIDAFSIDNTGAVAIANLGELTATEYELALSVSDPEGLSDTSTAIVPVVPNRAPVFDLDTFEFETVVAAEAETGDPVGTVTATDDNDGDPTSFAIVAGNDPDGNGTDTFSIDSETGEVTIADAGELSEAQYSLTVRAADTGDLSDEATVEIPVLLNAPPEVEDATFSVPEDSEVGTLVGTVTATDPDNDPLLFAIAAGNLDLDGDGTAAFAIAEDTGNITVADPQDLDFEQRDRYDLEVTATDPSGAGDTGAIGIDIEDVEPSLGVGPNNTLAFDAPAGESGVIQYALQGNEIPNVFEIGFFETDADGTLNGDLPGSDGVDPLALLRDAQTMFSVLAGGSAPAVLPELLSGLTRSVVEDEPRSIGFFLIEDATRDEVLDSGDTSGVEFGSLAISADGSGATLDFLGGELSVTAAIVEDAPLGTAPQGDAQQELIDRAGSARPNSASVSAACRRSQPSAISPGCTASTISAARLPASPPATKTTRARRSIASWTTPWCVAEPAATPAPLRSVPPPSPPVFTPPSSSRTQATTALTPLSRTCSATISLRESSSRATTTNPRFISRS